MPASALDAATAIEIEPRIPGGGGPVDEGPDGGGNGGGGDGDESRRRSLYRLGTLLTLAWVTMLFGALVVVFWVRSQSAFLWQPVEAPRALWASTAVLALSSWMLELSRQALRMKQWFAYRRRLLLTIYLGLGFIACQCAGLFELVRHGFYLKGNPHAAVFYIFAGSHALHLAGGMIALNWLLFQRRKNWPDHAIFAESVAIYWHFMGLVWIGLFVSLMLL